MNIDNVLALLNGFAADPFFADKYALAFRNQITPQEYLTALTTLPVIEVRSSTELQGANGAFSAQTGKIYLADTLVNGDQAQFTAVLIEEIGHYLDFHFNGNVDSDGDEGDIFSRLVRGQTIDQATLQALKTENDHATIILDGQVIEIEQALTSLNLASSQSYFQTRDQQDNFFYENVQTYNSAIGGPLAFRARFKNILLPGSPPLWNLGYTPISSTNYTSSANDTIIDPLDSTEKGLLIHTSQNGPGSTNPTIWEPTDVANPFLAQQFLQGLGTGTNSKFLLAEDTFKGTTVNLGTLSSASSGWIKVTLVWTGTPSTFDVDPDLDLKLRGTTTNTIYTPASPNGGFSFVGTETTSNATTDLIPNTLEYIEQIYVQPINSSDTRYEVTVSGTLNSVSSVVGQDFSIFFSVQNIVGNGHGWGDVHLQTFDGKAYEFQTAGEFILVKSLIDDFQVQTRQKPWGSSTSVSVNTAFATTIDGFNVVYDSELAVGEELSIDGWTFNLSSGETLSLYSSKIERQGNTYTFTYAGPDSVLGTQDDDVLIAGDYGNHLNIYVNPADYRSGLLQGLLGNGDGFTNNDFALRDGTNLGLNPGQWEINPTVHTTFANEWRITQAESLFGTPVYQDYNFPASILHNSPNIAVPITLAQAVDIPEETFLDADVDNKIINLIRSAGIPEGPFFDAAYFDVLRTGDLGFINSGADQARLDAQGSVIALT